MTGVKITYTLAICSALVAIIIVSFIMKGKWNILNLGFANVGIYGFIVLAYLLLQQTFSILNNKWWIPKIAKKCNRFPKTSIQVVGYHEDPKLFLSCLASISLQKYDNMGQIIAGIDGNSDQDMGMVNIFKEVFPSGKVLILDKLYQHMSQSQKNDFKATVANHKQVCIAQPHAGKRDIMYTCINAHPSDTELIALTDSDTMWETDTLLNLVQVMIGHDNYREQMNSRPERFWRSKVKECGSVTGDVGIWNIENYLTFLTALRYWSAFNCERAADSFFGVVTCVSGPLGLYRRQTLQQISHKWNSQQFMGKKCTFGDDRHLSNLVLEQNMSIFYTPFASCKTDSPAQLLRWIPQQTRWCKSFIREFFYNIKSFYKHPLWMSVELVFQLVYPFFVLVTLLYYVTFTLDLLLIIFSFIIIMTIVRSVLTVIRTGRLQFLHFTMYVFLYILFLIPSKFFAYLTVWNTQWGTSGRFARYGSIIKALHALVWAVLYSLFIIAMICKFIWRDHQSVTLSSGIVAASLLGYVIMLALHWNTWGRFILVPRITEETYDRYQNYKSYNDAKHGLTSSKYLKSVDEIHPETLTNLNEVQTI